MMILIISILAIWTVLGFFAMAWLPTSLYVDNNKQAMVLALALGPAVWAGMIWLALTDSEFRSFFKR